jgi:hypothetical protein
MNTERARSSGRWSKCIGLLALLAACSSMPQPECPAPSDLEGMLPTVDCGEAVTAAAEQLPDDHPEVVRIQVVPGEFRPILWGPAGAHVVFTYTDSHRVAVPLYLDDTTGDLIAEEVADYDWVSR